MPDDTPEIRFWKDETLRVIKATLDDAPTAPLASEEKRFGTEGESHADTPTAPCEECRIPLELDMNPYKPHRAHLCGACRRQLAREKWAE